MVSVAKLTLTVPPLLSRYHVDRADELRADPAALDTAWPTAEVLRVDPRGRFALDGTALVFARGHEIAAERPVGAVLLGRVDGALVFALRVEKFDGADLRMRGHLLSPVDSALIAEALGILNWHASAGFSPVDGGPTVPGRAGWVRSTESGAEEFPRTDAAMITLVHDGADQVLLGRQHQWPERLFSLFAGFVEPGESLEQCVARELREEVGIEVDDIAYVASQPWPFPRSLMLGFTARADREAQLTFHDGEIAEARWFSRLQVREALAAGDWSTDAPDAPLLLPNSISIARGIVEAWAGVD
ncbi:NAD(+) diphosphatase [Tsukamurella sp. 1534]|uniref:NAD(+) diphosphatase n=1 Tax=Tsukamurella sp. 1534 TaxID=1151061 RepID=UPI000592FCAC|nr:NAD(+) diphosphatase [Tsukamurella sp. 1534]